MKVFKLNANWKELLVFALIFITDSGLLTYTAFGYNAKIFFPIILLLFLVIHYLIHRINIKVHLAFIISVIFIIISCFVRGIYFGGWVPYICTLLIGYLLVQIIGIDNFIHSFLNVMRFIAVFSIISYVLLSVMGLKNLLPSITYSYNLNMPSKWCELIIYHTPLRETGVPRNYGIFWEPGTYSVYLNLAFLFSMTLSTEDRQIKDLFIFAVAIISTFSTTGYVAFAVTSVAILLQNRVTDKKTRRLLLLVIVISVILAVGLYWEEIYGNVFSKLFIRTSSFNSRWYSFVGNLRIAAKYPLLGCGLGLSANELSYLYSGLVRSSIHQTNTFLNYFATFGFVVGFIFINWWLNIIKKIAMHNKWVTLLLFISLFTMFSGENLIKSLFINVLMMYGLFSINRTEYNEDITPHGRMPI